MAPSRSSSRSRAAPPAAVIFCTSAAALLLLLFPTTTVKAFVFPSSSSKAPAAAAPAASTRAFTLSPLHVVLSPRQREEKELEEQDVQRVYGSIAQTFADKVREEEEWVGGWVGEAHTCV